MVKKIVLGLILAVLSVGVANANSYKAKLKVVVCDGQTGMGKVYAFDTDEEPFEYVEDSVSADVSSSVAGEMKTLYAFAKSNDDALYEFLGWSESEGGTIISVDNPYEVNIACSDEVSIVNTVTLYANFFEKGVSTMTFIPSEHGSYTATDGVSSVDGSGSFTTHKSVTFSAIPAEGYKLMGWYYVDSLGQKTYFSTENVTEKWFNIDVQVGADFIESKVPVFAVKNKSGLFTDLSEVNANALEGDVIVLVSDGELNRGSYTISKGKTLLIPFNNQFTCYDDFERPVVSNDRVQPSVFRTLTMKDGASLNIEGKMSVSADMFAIKNTQKLPGGAPNGDYGHVLMESGSSIVLNDSSFLYAWGYITGDGRIVANAGSCVYEGFQLTEFRGGTVLSGIVGNDSLVFPFNQYYIQNVEVPMTVCYGAKEMVTTAFFADGKPFGTEPFPLIGNGGLFLLDEGAKVTKRLDTERDRQVYELDGNARLGNIKFSMRGIIVSSDDYVLPLTNNLSIFVDNGTMTIDKEHGVALLSGAELTVKKDATLRILDSKMYIYDEDVWGDFSGFYSFVPTYSPTCTYDRGLYSIGDAVLDVQGTVVTENGDLYTTSSGAKIICSEGKGQFVVNKETQDDITFQVEQRGYDLTFVPIDVVPAMLSNSSEYEGTENEFTLTSGIPAGTVLFYHQETGMWDTDEIPTAIGCIQRTGNFNLGEDASVMQTSNVFDIYNINGARRAAFGQGVNILKSSDGTVKKVVVK